MDNFLKDIEDFEENINNKSTNIKDDFAVTTFPEWVHSKITFEPYKNNYDVPFELRHDKEWLLFKCNHELYENNDDYGTNSASIDLFYNYRIKSLKNKFAKINQYYYDYVLFLKAKKNKKQIPPSLLGTTLKETNEEVIKSNLSLLKYEIENQKLSINTVSNLLQVIGYNDSFKYEIENNYLIKNSDERKEYKQRLTILFNEIPENISVKCCINIDNLIFSQSDVSNLSELLKSYKEGMIKSLKEVQNPQEKSQKQDETEQTEQTEKIKQYISDEFKAIDNKGWKYIFRKEEDYNTFTDLLTDFFAHKKYTPPRKIKLQRKCKTKLAGVLNDIYSKLCEGYSKLKTDEPFFKIVRVLDVFSDEDKDSLYKDITRYKSRSNH